LLGSNGAGKTTTIKMLTTLLAPSSGEARVAGFSITKDAVDVRRAIGYVPQAVSVDGSLTGYENLLIFAKLYGLPHGERRRAIHEALEFMGLTADSGRMVGQYSAAWSAAWKSPSPRCIGLACSSWMSDGRAGSDCARRGLEAPRRSADQLRHTLFFTTHYLEEAQSYCDRIAIMHLGKMDALGTCQRTRDLAGGDGHTLNDVFVHYAGSAIDSSGNLTT